MKKILLFLSLSILTILCACEKEKKISLDVSSITVDAAGGKVTVHVFSNTDWTVSTSEAWVSTSISSGSGNADVDIISLPNLSTSADKSQVIFRITNSVAILEVNRKARPEEIVDPVLFVDPDIIDASYDGGVFVINITSNTEWTVSSNKSWIDLNKKSGTGISSVTLKVSKNSEYESDDAIISVETKDGLKSEVKLYREGMPYDDFKYVVDCEGNVYPTVWIDNQLWMAENLRCTHYDTHSGLNGVSINELTESTYAPYYIDGRNAPMYKGGDLTDEQRSKLGFLYNWAAAVGIEDGLKREVGFTGPRQGICPNGWHLPIEKEWNTLKNYIEVIDGKGVDIAAKYLKSVSGWSINTGLDEYGFNILPSGYCDGTKALNVGFDASFWTSTSKSFDEAYSRGLSSTYEYIYEGSYDKSTGRSVRCVKNF